MTIFDIIRDIIHDKKGDLHHELDFDSAVKSPYLLQRWVSMATTGCAYILSQTTNKTYTGLEDSEMWYKMLVSLIQKDRNFRVTYLKREYKAPSENVQKIVEVVAQQLEISKQEVMDYIDFFNIDLKPYSKMLNIKG